MIQPAGLGPTPCTACGAQSQFGAQAEPSTVMYVVQGINLGHMLHVMPVLNWLRLLAHGLV